MTDDRSDLTTDVLGRRFSQMLHEEAERIEVPDRWAEISSRLAGPLPDTQQVEPVRPKRRRRSVAIAVCSIAVALVVIVAVTFGGWRLFGSGQPAGQYYPTTVPRYDPGIPNLVVYRSNISEARGPQQPSQFFISPETRRTDDKDYGVAALEALFDTSPVHTEESPGWGHGDKDSGPDTDHAVNHDWTHWQEADITSVMRSGGLIRVELNGFSSNLADTKARAHVMAQAWVYTLQDTLGTREDLLITVQGQPFLLYGEVDTSVPLKRDEKIWVKHFTGFDSPVDGDVVGTPFMIAGYADAAPDRPARLEVVNLDTGVVVVDQTYTQPTRELAPPQDVNFGRHRCTLEGIDAAGNTYRHEIVITVVP